MEVRVLFRAQTMKQKTIAIINDSEVTVGSLPSNILSINAWDINWDDLSLDDNYIILGAIWGPMMIKSSLTSKKKNNG